MRRTILLVPTSTRIVAAAVVGAGLAVWPAVPEAMPPTPSSVAPPTQDPAAGETPLEPFAAHYTAYWKSISVGTSDLKLQRDEQPDHYVYTWTITAHGIFRLVYSNPVVQKSWLMLSGGHVRPLKYHGDDGSSAVDLEFDWEHDAARGRSEGKPVDLRLEDGTLDVMAIQLEIMLSLRKGTLPPTYRIIDKDEVKDFDYAFEGGKTLATEIGALDTLVVASHRAGSNRILRMWFAPALGYVPVQAERTREGRLEFAMRIKSLTR
jgi:hypothetical protein